MSTTPITEGLTLREGEGSIAFSLRVRDTYAKEAALNDLRDRLTRADWELKGMKHQTERIHGKAQGVQLALSYVDEALRALH